MKKINLTLASFMHLVNLHGISFEATYDVPCWEDQEYYGEPCTGSQTATTVTLPSGLQVVGYEVFPPKSEPYFYTQVFKK